MIGDLLQADIKTMQSLKDAVELLHTYANSELELTGHSQEVATALILTLQTASALSEQINELDQRLVERSKQLFQLNKS